MVRGNREAATGQDSGEGVAGSLFLQEHAHCKLHNVTHYIM